ncbi:hypothetical protein AB1484_00030 [Parafrankia sp. FMc6]|uniref:hypothetical protein n=1 Tax=Parafrankia soli TaxID=2599596 RepID=UPI0034D64370
MVSQAVPTPIRLSRACSTLSPKTTSVVVPGRIEVANGLRSALQNTGLTVSTGLSPGVVTAQLPPAQKAAAYADRPAELSTSELSLLLDGFRLAFAALGLLCLTGIAAALAPGSSRDSAARLDARPGACSDGGGPARGRPHRGGQDVHRHFPWRMRRVPGASREKRRIPREIRRRFLGALPGQMSHKTTSARTSLDRLTVQPPHLNRLMYSDLAD